MADSFPCYIVRGGWKRLPPEKFRVALVQMSCGPEPEQNLEKALSRVADAAGRGAQVICLPELFQTQYFCQREDHSLFDLAEPIPALPARNWRRRHAAMA